MELAVGGGVSRFYEQRKSLAVRLLKYIEVLSKVVGGKPDGSGSADSSRGRYCEYETEKEHFVGG